MDWDTLPSAAVESFDRIVQRLIAIVDRLDQIAERLGRRYAWEASNVYPINAEFREYQAALGRWRAQALLTGLSADDLIGTHGTHAALISRFNEFRAWGLQPV